MAAMPAWMRTRARRRAAASWTFILQTECSMACTLYMIMSVQNNSVELFNLCTVEESILYRLS